MGVLDEHNRQHTFGTTSGPPTSVVGVSAQQAIDAQRRLAEGTGRTAGARGMSARDTLVVGMGAGAVALVAVLAAFGVGGIGAVALALVALCAGLISVVFFVAALLRYIGQAARR